MMHKFQNVAAPAPPFTRTQPNVAQGGLRVGTVSFGFS